MNIIAANKELVSPLCLYAMQGFYLLVVPLDGDPPTFKVAFMGDEVVVLFSAAEVTVININHNVGELLKRQMALISDNPTVLGVMTKAFDAAEALEAVNFVAYKPLDALSERVTSAQWVRIMKYCQENNANENS